LFYELTHAFGHPHATTPPANYAKPLPPVQSQKTKRLIPMAKRRLLCVDDDSCFRQFYKNLLGTHGFEVTVAASGSQALKLFLTRKIDAVLTDFEMPGMTGAELAARLKRLRPELPVVLVSGSRLAVETPPEAVDLALAKGAPMTKLVDQVEVLLARSFSRPAPLRPARLIPLGSVLASIALGVYLFPRVLK
jgi:CheY-like chemotaxis protein